VSLPPRASSRFKVRQRIPIVVRPPGGFHLPHLLKLLRAMLRAGKEFDRALAMVPICDRNLEHGAEADLRHAESEPG
jgi:hypothetical protein